MTDEVSGVVCTLGAPCTECMLLHEMKGALTFPDWGTQRSSWRDSDVTVTGDTKLAARFLDTVNVI